MIDVVVFLRTVVEKHHCGGLLCLMWMDIVIDVVVFFWYCGGYVPLWWVIYLPLWVIVLDVVIFLRTMVETHYSGELLCSMWWVVVIDVVDKCVVVDKHYCCGLLCLMWYDIVLDLVVLFTYGGG